MFYPKCGSTRWKWKVKSIAFGSLWLSASIDSVNWYIINVFCWCCIHLFTQSSFYRFIFAKHVCVNDKNKPPHSNYVVCSFGQFGMIRFSFDRLANSCTKYERQRIIRLKEISHRYSPSMIGAHDCFVLPLDTCADACLCVANAILVVAHKSESGFCQIQNDSLNFSIKRTLLRLAKHDDCYGQQVHFIFSEYVPFTLYPCMFS